MLKENVPRLLLGLILVLIAGCVALWWGNTHRLASASAWVRHTQEVEQRLESLNGALTALESGARGYALSGEHAFRDDELHGEQQAQERLADLRLMTADNQSQQSSLDELTRAVDAKLEFSRQMLAERDRDGVGGAASVVATRRGLALMGPIAGLLAKMRGEEERLLAARTSEVEQARRQTLLLGSGMMALLLTALVCLGFLIRADRRARRRANEATRQSEERMRLLLGAVRDYAILDLDPEGVIQTSTGAAVRIFGRDPTGDHIRSLYPQASVRAGLPARELEKATLEGRFEDEGPRLRNDGTTFWADVVTTAIRDRNGQLRGFAKVIRDVTEQKEIDDALRETTRQLEVSNRELQDFAMVASHDLQEPLRKVQMFGDKLKRRYSAALSEEGLDWLTRMMNAAMRGQSLIQGLLAFSRVTTKAQPPVPVDLYETAREVASDLEARIADAGGQVEIGQLPTIEADPLQMRQLLQNLIGNALKFRKPGQPPIVRLEARELRRDCYEIEVTDNGIGFEQKYVDRIFKLFQRLHERGVYEGSGMGLAICRKIVERHGGTITARSAPGAGTTFLIDLPAQQPAAAH
ncbi:MAG TPA: CHASE3 domain-containing protein [Myxococcales bacterium]|nr:CHASE3 domain-containing protein [Myxococcales bacterium]